MATIRTIKIGSLAPGINNRLQPTELDTVLPDSSRGSFLYGADNVDIGKKGFLKRRRGTTSVSPLPCHSLWADALGTYVVADGNLVELALSADGLTTGASTLLRAAMPAASLSYSRGADGEVYWTNGVALRRIANHADHPVVTPAPTFMPTVTVGSGALAAGTYLLAFTASGVDGESPATEVFGVKVPDNSSLQITSPALVNVYMSAPDGDLLTYQGAWSSTVIYTWNGNGHECHTLTRVEMPAGQLLTHYRGRLAVARGPIVYFSDPWNYGILDIAKNYLAFPQDINLLVSTAGDDVLYIGSDQTYAVGDPFSDVMRTVMPYGATLGSQGVSPSDGSAYWHSSRGLVQALPNSSVKNTQEDNLEFTDAQRGASLFRERDGTTHIVTTRGGVNSSSAAAYSYINAEVIRKGTVL